MALRIRWLNVSMKRIWRTREDFLYMSNMRNGEEHLSVNQFPPNTTFLLAVVPRRNTLQVSQQGISFIIRITIWILFCIFFLFHNAVVHLVLFVPVFWNCFWKKLRKIVLKWERCMNVLDGIPSCASGPDSPCFFSSSFLSESELVSATEISGSSGRSGRTSIDSF